MNELRFLSLDSVHVIWIVVILGFWWWRTIHNRYRGVHEWLSPSLDDLMVRAPLRLQIAHFAMVILGLLSGVQLSTPITHS